MKSAEAWELRGLKIFCVLSAVAACFGLFYEALNPSPLLIGKVLQYAGTGVWITGTVLIARYASTKRYVSNLISAILVGFSAYMRSVWRNLYSSWLIRQPR